LEEDSLVPAESVQERHLVYVSRLVADVASVKRPDLQERLLSPECLSFLRFCAKSRNKQVLLNTVKTLGELFSNGSLLSNFLAYPFVDNLGRVLEEYGMDVFLELNDLVDIDLHHATEDTIRNLQKAKGNEKLVLSLLWE
jgi:hypothetical protein